MEVQSYSDRSIHRSLHYFVLLELILHLIKHLKAKCIYSYLHYMTKKRKCLRKMRFQFNIFCTFDNISNRRCLGKDMTRESRKFHIRHTHDTNSRKFSSNSISLEVRIEIKEKQDLKKQ